MGVLPFQIALTDLFPLVINILSYKIKSSRYTARRQLCLRADPNVNICDSMANGLYCRSLRSRSSRSSGSSGTSGGTSGTSQTSLIRYRYTGLRRYGCYTSEDSRTAGMTGDNQIAEFHGTVRLCNRIDRRRCTAGVQLRCRRPKSKTFGTGSAGGSLRSCRSRWSRITVASELDG